jgi:hypothetical protein
MDMSTHSLKNMTEDFGKFVNKLLTVLYPYKSLFLFLFPLFLTGCTRSGIQQQDKTFLDELLKILLPSSFGCSILFGFIAVIVDEERRGVATAISFLSAALCVIFLIAS